MAKILLILLTGLLLEAVGVVYLSKGLKQIGAVERVSVSEVARIVKAGLTNPSLLLGVLFEALFFGCLLVLMARGDVSFIWPLTSLGFVLTTLAARFILHETVVPLRWVGVCLIVLGAGLITWTEQNKPPAAALALTAQSTASPPASSTPPDSPPRLPPIALSTPPQTPGEKPRLSKNS